jgi:hypothetical protein
VTTSGSYISAGDPRVHFGMGAEKAAQGIEIRWPSGIRQTLKNVPGGRSKSLMRASHDASIRA